jgi:hypothetical protein
MSYFIFLKNSDNIEGSLYRIAENQDDLNYFNVQSYKVIEDNQINFDNVKYGNKIVLKYSDNTIYYDDLQIIFPNALLLKNDIDSKKNQIKCFTDNNKDHPLFNRWNNYYNQLNNLNLDSIIYPLNKSLERYFNDLGQPSLNILQLL